MPTSPVDHRELLYRQVSTGGEPIYYDPARKPPVHRAAFLPTRKDGDGLSVIRSRFRSLVWSAYRLERPADRFRLACILASTLNQFAGDHGIQDLHYTPTPDRLDKQYGEPFGHCSVAAINRAEYDADEAARVRIKEWALAVANHITNEDVLGPFAQPTENDHYRPPADHE